MSKVLIYAADAEEAKALAIIAAPIAGGPPAALLSGGALPEVEAAALAATSGEGDADGSVAAASKKGNEVAARAAEILDAGCVTEALSVQESGGSLTAKRAIYGGRGCRLRQGARQERAAREDRRSHEGEAHRLVRPRPREERGHRRGRNARERTRRRDRLLASDCRGAQVAAAGAPGRHHGRHRQARPLHRARHLGRHPAFRGHEGRKSHRGRQQQ